MAETTLTLYESENTILESFVQKCIEEHRTFGLSDEQLLEMFLNSEYVRDNLLYCIYSNTENPYSTKEKEREIFIYNNRYNVYGDRADPISDDKEEELRTQFDMKGDYTSPKCAETIEQAAAIALQICKSEKCSNETCEEYDLYNKLGLDDYDKETSQIFRTKKYIIAL